MVCFRCKRVIHNKDNYYAFNEFDGGKLISTDYAHRKCWDDFLKMLGNADEAMGILRGVKTKLQEQGVLPLEELEIK